jgi:hypothetical protein
MTGRLAEIGREWHTRLKRFFDTPLESDATPLEICQAVLDEVERKVQPVGRGRRVFPYSRIVVRFRESNGDGTEVDAVFAGLSDRIRERLAELRCEVPSSLDVDIGHLENGSAEPPDRLFAIEYHSDRDPVHQAQAAVLPSVQVSILKGAASDEEYTFTDPLISIGRSSDLIDELGRVRRNRVAFLDVVDGVTETVGRAHARLRFDPHAREYRLFDDGSSNGTCIIRGGAAIPVVPRDPRGVRIRSGDEVQIGRALIRIVLR